MAEVDHVEYAAMHGEKMPAGLDVFEQLRYHGLSFIYSNYRVKAASKETASAYKQSLLKTIQDMRKEYEFGIKCYQNSAANYKATEAAKNAYRTGRTLENADKLVAVLDGLEEIK